MDKRAAFAPMDFEYDNKHGVVDSQSPFFTTTMNRPCGPNGFQVQTQRLSSFSNQTPSTPVRQSSQSSFLSQIPSLKTPQQFEKGAFRNLRNNIDIDFSSGAENLSSPENADNEDTPEQISRSSPSKISNNVNLFRGNTSPSKATFSHVFGKHTTPGRGEIPRKNYSDALARRVHKRKRRDLERDNRMVPRRPSHDSDSEERSRPSSSQGPDRQHPPQEMGFIPSILSFVDTHPNLPHTLAYYVQLLLNASIVFFVLYMIYCSWATIRRDVDMKSEETTAETLAEMAVCAREFVENRCDRDSRVPAMETVCNNWEICMKRDPHAVGRARISAVMFAEIFNGLIEPISYKVMIFCLTLIFGCVAISNFAFSFLAKKTPLPPVSHYPPPLPQQPAGFPTGGHYYAPYPSQIATSGVDTASSNTGRDSPMKRLGFH